MSAGLVFDYPSSFTSDVVANVGAPYQYFEQADAYVFGIEEGENHIHVGFKHHSVHGPQILIPQVDVNENMWKNIIKEYVAVALYGYIIPGKFQEDPEVPDKEFFICTLPASLPATQVALIISDALHLCLLPHKQEQEVVKKAELVCVMEDLGLPGFIRLDAEAGNPFDACGHEDSGYESDTSFNLEDHQDLSEEVRKLIMA